MDGVRIDVKVTVGPPQQPRVVTTRDQDPDRAPREGVRPQRRQTVKYGVPKSTDGHL